MLFNVAIGSLVLVVASMESGCQNTCSQNNVSYPPVPPVITVTNGASGQLICDATVIAQCPGGEMAVLLFTGAAADASADCQYGTAVRASDGGIEAIDPLDEGACTLFVSEPGFQSVVVPSVGLQAGGCTPGTAQHVNVSLQKS